MKDRMVIFLVPIVGTLILVPTVLWWTDARARRERARHRDRGKRTIEVRIGRGQRIDQKSQDDSAKSKIDRDEIVKIFATI